jgi:hypothetical protein
VKVIRRTGPLALIENLHDIGKIKVQKETVSVEADRVVSLLRGRDVSPWRALPSLSMLLTQDAQTRTGISETIMKRSYPKLYAYLKSFESILRKRSGFKKYLAKEPFYSIYNFGSQHLARNKVVWRDMGSAIQCAVISGPEAVCPEHHVMFVSTDSEDEAHYLCGSLMNSFAKLVIAGYTTTTGISTHVLGVIAIPKYDASKVHKAIAKQSRAAHTATEDGDEHSLRRAQEALDSAAEALWKCKPGEGALVRAAFEELARRFQAPEATDDEDFESGEE